MSFYFPLYQDLKTKISNFSLSDSDKNNLLDMLKANKEDENIYLLMRSYEQEASSKINPDALPFDGKQLKSSIRFDFDKIPLELKLIFLVYFSLKTQKDV